jgi:hypothetical protein
MNRITSLLVAALLAAFTLPTEVSAQLVKNTNLSRKLGSVLVGGSGNLISSNVTTAFIGGGTANKASSNNATVGGGQGNTASGGYATVGGGLFNTASGVYATVGGGADNTASNNYDTVSGGGRNTASGGSATVGGGFLNTASAVHATVGGGYTNTASGNYSCVPGGVSATALHTGSFVYNGDEGEPTASFGDGTFTVRCEGGARFYTGSGTSTGVALGPSGVTWGSPSDSNLKTKITAVDPRRILAKIAAMPVTEWEYKVDPDRRYIGPMAQDFHTAFGLGSDDKTITTLDSDGVMYAAIQGLVEELKERDKVIGELKSELDAVKDRLDSLPPGP